MLSDIKELHIEPTSLCNAECPMCARNLYGEGLNPLISLQGLTLEWFEKNLPTDAIRNLDKIFFCGNVGDPACTPQLLDIIEYLKACKPNLTVGLNTNGGIKTPTWWTKLGSMLQDPRDYCVFSIDGLADTNHLYRKNVKWDKIMTNATAFISTGASAHWDMLVFEHNKHQVESAQNLAKQMGFTWFRSKQTDRWDTYTKTKLHPAEEYVKLDYNNIEKVTCEKNRDKSAFIDYKGKFWPCCHIAEAYINQVGYELHKELREFDNEQLMSEYQTRLDQKNPFYTCKRTCGTSEGKRSQWKTEVEFNEVH